MNISTITKLCKSLLSAFGLSGRSDVKKKRPSAKLPSVKLPSVKLPTTGTASGKPASAQTSSGGINKPAAAVGGQAVGASAGAVAYVSLTDIRDGQTYKTVRIGGLVWMAENLRFNADGSLCYDNDESNGERYGRLYTYEAARAACPAGWRLPTQEEWVSLARGVNGGEERREGGASLWFPDAGMKLKSAGGDWSSDDCREGEDVCGFCALPSHADCAGEAKWWSSSVGAGRDSVHVFAMSGEYDDAYVDETPKSGMYLVRCVKE